jgi:hypothetical protein
MQNRRIRSQVQPRLWLADELRGRGPHFRMHAPILSCRLISAEWFISFETNDEDGDMRNSLV